MRRINAFDWAAEFPDVFGRQNSRAGSLDPAGKRDARVVGQGLQTLPEKNRTPGRAGKGGFDAVIGNPPYVRIQTLKEQDPKQVAFFKQRYEAAAKGNYDIYVVMIERGLELLNKTLNF